MSEEDADGTDNETDPGPKGGPSTPDEIKTPNADDVDNPDIAKLKIHLLRKWGEHAPCPMCHRLDWTVGEYFWTPSSFRSKGIHLGGKVMPMVALICTNCGQTQFVNAIVAGLLPPDPQEAPNE